MSTGDTRVTSETDFRERINRVELPEPVATLADDYEQHFEDRNRYLWQWIYSLFPEFTLSPVAAEHATEVRTQKTVLTMYVTVLDDLVENHDDRRTFEEARRLTQASTPVDPEQAAVDADQFAFIERLWDTFETSVAEAPRYGEFADIFEYDMQQTMNAMAYSGIVNETPAIANISGATHYDAHNMVMFPYADVDLMFSPEFEFTDFGMLRDCLWNLQEMARIGNWVTTWEREVREGDYSSGIVVRALQERITTPDELEHSPNHAIEKIKARDIEQQFCDRWADRCRAARNREYDTTSVDLDALVDGMETVFEYHLASRGDK